jgi:hypothetical protein
MKRWGDDALVLFGGSMGSSYHADLWRFDVPSESWEELPMDGMAPVGRRAAWVAPASGGGLYVGFGLQGAQPLPDLWHADLAAQTWTSIAFEVPPGARAFTPALPGELGWVIGGFDGAGPLADAWQLTPTTP